MSTEYPESLWRCPADGAFHVADMADYYQEMDQYRCTKCEGWVNVELVHEGMANAVNQPKPVYKNTFAKPLAPSYIRICDRGEDLIKVYFDGRVEFGPNYTPDAAAKAFWEAIGGLAPNRKD